MRKLKNKLLMFSRELQIFYSKKDNLTNYQSLLRTSEMPHTIQRQLSAHNSAGTLSGSVCLLPAGDGSSTSRALVVHVRDVACLAHHMMIAWSNEHIWWSSAAHDAKLRLSQRRARLFRLNMLNLDFSLGNVLSL